MPKPVFASRLKSCGYQLKCDPGFVPFSAKFVHFLPDWKTVEMGMGQGVAGFMA
ncbi:MAG: hypothetical protein ACE5G9_13140 [Nitrospinales bacterium]